MVRARRQAKSLESNTRVKRVASVAWRGFTLRSKYSANCLRRKRFSAARVQLGCKLSLMNLRASSHRSKVVSSRWRRELSLDITDRIAHQSRHRTYESGRTELLRRTAVRSACAWH